MKKRNKRGRRKKRKEKEEEGGDGREEGGRRRRVMAVGFVAMALSFFISLSLCWDLSRCRRWCFPSLPMLGFSCSVATRPTLYCSPHLLYASAGFLFAIAGPGLWFLSCHAMFCCATIVRVSTAPLSLGKGFVAPPSLLYTCSIFIVAGKGVNGYDDSNLDKDIDNNALNDNDKITAFDIEDPDLECSSCKARMWSDEQLAKTNKYRQPKFVLCCMEKKVELPQLRHPPPELAQLHSGKDIISQHFLKNIRSFNAMFNFTSMARKVDHQINRGTTLPVFKLGGENYHLIGKNEINNRLSTISHTNKANDGLSQHLARTFRYARDRKYDLPTSSEVTALIVGDVEQLAQDTYIVIETKTKRLQRIDYPLLFSYGEDDFRKGIPLSRKVPGRRNPEDDDISMRRFFAYKIQHRIHESPILLKSRILF
ncbi:hypothetical protein Ahy_Scaffold6g108046 [Arachis hypogaea]|uniref:Helitron helicase-like domain-containing protein n=1 Tax=Arachis hypogaea TaxID=3818 RepID=A0A444WP71_ARAHY|nr:hypothetical protein Ahy_Scaffold6g108046 [Arachis hypogaea]